jgi:hypothetical protein
MNCDFLNLLFLVGINKNDTKDLLNNSCKIITDDS